MRTKHDPLKWPILDRGDLVEPPQLPPFTKTVKDLQLDNLNPNVAEFVPHEFTGSNSGLLESYLLFELNDIFVLI